MFLSYCLWSWSLGCHGYLLPCLEICLIFYQKEGIASEVGFKEVSLQCTCRLFLCGFLPPCILLKCFNLGADLYNEEGDPRLAPSYRRMFSVAQLNQGSFVDILTMCPSLFPRWRLEHLVKVLAKLFDWVGPPTTFLCMILRVSGLVPLCSRLPSLEEMLIQSWLLPVNILASHFKDAPFGMWLTRMKPLSDKCSH